MADFTNAKFIEARPSMSNVGATDRESLPSGAGSLIRTNQWGIDAVLRGFIIQNVTITGSRIYDTTQDQKGAVVSELDYDEEQTMSMEVIGGNGAEDVDQLYELSATNPDSSVTVIETGIIPGNIAFEWNNKYWKIRSVTYNGSYNDKKRYTIEAVRYRNFPVNELHTIVTPNYSNTLSVDDGI